MINPSFTLSSQKSLFKICKAESIIPRFKSTRAYSPYSASSSSSSSKIIDNKNTNAVVETEKIPRPLNSFMIFRLEKQREIVEKCPGANHRDISKIISKWWKELSKPDKEWYVAEAEKRKIEHKALQVFSIFSILN